LAKKMLEEYFPMQLNLNDLNKYKLHLIIYL